MWAEVCMSTVFVFLVAPLKPLITVYWSSWQNSNSEPVITVYLLHSINPWCGPFSKVNMLLFCCHLLHQWPHSVCKTLGSATNLHFISWWVSLRCRQDYISLLFVAKAKPLKGPRAVLHRCPFSVPLLYLPSQKHSTQPAPAMQAFFKLSNLLSLVLLMAIMQFCNDRSRGEKMAVYTGTTSTNSQMTTSDD